VFSSNLKQFIELKKRWKVAIAAMIHRCKDLSVFDDQQYVNLRKQISFNKWLKNEPLDDKIPVEQPQLVGKAMSLAISSGIKIATDFLMDLRLSAEALAKISGLSAEVFAIEDAGPSDIELDLIK